MDRGLAEGFRVLAAVAAGADTPTAISARLDLDAPTTASHLDRLAAAGAVRREGERVLLGDRMATLLDGLVARSDLVAIAAPIVLEAEQRLGVTIDVSVVADAEPTAITGSSPFAVVDAPEGRRVVAPVLDVAQHVACVLGVTVDGMAPEALEVLGKELVATADEISVLLPRIKDRGPDWFLRF